MTMGAAYAALTRAQKPAKGVSLYSRFVNRRLGRVFAAMAAHLGLRPNAVTAMAGLVTAAAVVLIASVRPSLWLGATVAALLVLGFALDAADGQLARLLGQGSPAGEWLDHVIDAGKSVALHAAVLVTAYRHFDVSSVWLLVPICYQILAVVVFAAGTLRELLGRLAGLAPTAATTRPSRWRAALLLPADFGVLALAFLTLPWTPVFVVVYSALFVANLLVGGMLLAKWLRELSALTRS
jgi:phosphatidylglycerophosphate synthase